MLAFLLFQFSGIIRDYSSKRSAGRVDGDAESARDPGHPT